MLSRLREHLGGAGLIVAIVALVAALAGGAIAANGGTGDGKATASAKAKKGPRGPKGPKGDTGPQGPAGPAGPQGPKGDTGAAGSNGSNGSNGTNGATGPTGKDGATGATGATGADGTFSTEPLPADETLTGVWSATGNGDAAPAAISFPISVSPAPTAILKSEIAGSTIGTELKNGDVDVYGPHSCVGDPGDPTDPECIFFGTEEEWFERLQESTEAWEAACPGSAAAPEAESGLLCIYKKDSDDATEPLFSSTAAAKSEAAHEFGVTVPFEFAPGGGFARGSWAVTG